MKPFLRAADRGPLAPVGWVAEPVAQWTDRRCDAVYDPARHDVMHIDTHTPDQLRCGLAQAGYRLASAVGNQELWYRDRVEAARAALARIDHAAASRSATAHLPSPA